MSSTSDVDQEDLCSASRDGDVALVSQLLANHSFDADDATAALDQAGLNLTIIRLLLQHGADVNTFHLPMTPLSKAPGELLRLLAEYGYDFKSDGHRILQDFGHDRSMLDWLLDQGADINRTDNRRLDSGFNLAPGETDDSLHLLNNTVASGYIDLFDHLVRRGADTSLCTALHAASRCPDGPTSIAMVRYLLDKHNMDINRDNDDLRHFEHDSQDAGSPLCSAILHKNLTVVHELLARGARVKDDPACSLICYYAAKPGGFLPALEPLLRAGADATQALQQIVSTRNIDAAKACLQFGADPTPALRKAIAQEEYRANTIAENEAYDKAKPQSNYKKSETLIEEEMAEERDSQAMVNLLKSALE